MAIVPTWRNQLPTAGKQNPARALNARGVATARGGDWTAVQVGSILHRMRGSECVVKRIVATARTAGVKSNSSTARINSRLGDARGADRCVRC